MEFERFVDDFLRRVRVDPAEYTINCANEQVKSLSVVVIGDENAGETRGEPREDMAILTLHGRNTQLSRDRLRSIVEGLRKEIAQLLGIPTDLRESDQPHIDNENVFIVYIDKRLANKKY